jgi:hypothetical protein
MNKNEYEKLTELLDKLGKELKATRFCIIPRYIHEGCHIGIYDADGNLDKAVTAINIEEAVKQLTQERWIKNEL